MYLISSKLFKKSHGKKVNTTIDDLKSKQGFTN